MLEIETDHSGFSFKMEKDISSRNEENTARQRNGSWVFASWHGRRNQGNGFVHHLWNWEKYQALSSRPPKSQSAAPRAR